MPVRLVSHAVRCGHDFLLLVLGNSVAGLMLQKEAVCGLVGPRLLGGRNSAVLPAASRCAQFYIRLSLQVDGKPRLCLRTIVCLII
ncbi:hypothetical protein V8C44DRAFT_315535 [Trichoderma aethiopicum]